jgi:predicted metal-dependent hydrolase
MTRPVIVIAGAPSWGDEAAARLTGYTPIRYTERGRYVARLADDHAALILVEGDGADWRYFTTTPKTSPATRRIPVVVVSDDAATRAAALAAGADRALTPDDLLSQLDALAQELARVTDDEAAATMLRQCGEPLPPEALEAIERFNRGEFYKQHDLFEALWMAETGPVRDLYRAVLQVGIAYYQITLGNYNGALKMLLRSVQWLALLPDVCRGVDVAALRRDAAAVRAELERVGADGLANFDRSLLRPVRRVGEDLSGT